MSIILNVLLHNRSLTGGYVFFETSSLSVHQLPGVQAKAWLKR